MPEMNMFLFPTLGSIRATRIIFVHPMSHVHFRFGLQSFISLLFGNVFMLLPVPHKHLLHAPASYLFSFLVLMSNRSKMQKKVHFKHIIRCCPKSCIGITFWTLRFLMFLLLLGMAPNCHHSWLPPPPNDWAIASSGASGPLPARERLQHPPSFLGPKSKAFGCWWASKRCRSKLVPKTSKNLEMCLLYYIYAQYFRVSIQRIYVYIIYICVYN